jgi:predicted secreted protein
LAFITTVALLGGCVAVFSGAAFPAAQGAAAMLTLTEQDNGRRFPVHVGDLLEIHLAENATAGYRWAPDSYDNTVLELAEATASYPNATVGSGGEAIFRFRVVGVGSSTLTLKYWRHWEGSGSIIQRFAVTIDATP